MNKTAKSLTVLVLFAVIATTTVQAHCQIPCGIYNDEARFILMKEHVATIEKSMTQIETAANQNQTVRWVMNKDKHADELTKIVTYYFMAQRIKPGCENYAIKVAQLHEMVEQVEKQFGKSLDMNKLKKVLEFSRRAEEGWNSGTKKMLPRDKVYDSFIEMVDCPS